MPRQTTFRFRPLTKFLALLTITVFLITSAPAVQAISWRDLFQRGVQVIQLSNVSTRQEIALGDQIHRNLLSQGMRLNRSRSLNDYVNRIGRRLEPGVQRSRIPYRFHVVDDNAVNAYATAGGHTYVTTGLMKTADNEAQLASVVAHEISHIDERHLIQQIRQQTIARGIVATALGSDRNALANIGTEIIFNRPQSRGDEFEADEVGLDILRQANYNVSAMPAFMRKLLGSSRTPTFLSTHPAVPERINRLESAIQTGPLNNCDRANVSSSCGLDQNAYNRDVKARL